MNRWMGQLSLLHLPTFEPEKVEESGAFAGHGVGGAQQRGLDVDRSQKSEVRKGDIYIQPSSRDTINQTISESVNR